jgi:hypothetical protein
LPPAGPTCDAPEAQWEPFYILCSSAVAACGCQLWKPPRASRSMPVTITMSRQGPLRRPLSTRRFLARRPPARSHWSRLPHRVRRPGDNVQIIASPPPKSASSHHTLLIPRRHTPSYLDLFETERPMPMASAGIAPAAEDMGVINGLARDLSAIGAFRGGD